MNDNDDITGELHDVERMPLNGTEDLTSFLNRQLFQWWQSTRGGRPRYADFDVLDHPKLIPYLHLYQVLSPDSVQLRINGEAVAESFGHSWAKTVLSASADDPVHATLAQYILSVAEMEKPHYCVGTLSHVERGFIGFESIDCPLWGADGTVSHVIGSFVPTRKGNADGQDGD